MTAPRERSIGDLVRAMPEVVPFGGGSVRAFSVGISTERLDAIARVLDAADALRERVADVLKSDLAIGGDPWHEPALQDEHKGHHYDLTGLSRAYDAALRELRKALEGGK